MVHVGVWMHSSRGISTLLQVVVLLALLGPLLLPLEIFVLSLCLVLHFVMVRMWMHVVIMGLSVHFIYFSIACDQNRTS